jgi:hypothetical protein
VAIPNFNDPAFAGQTGLEPQMLQGIIDACTQASANMARVNTTVGDAADSVIAAMDSEAGIILRGRLQTWFDDFAVVTSKFDELNARATQMRAALIAADSEATAGAGAGQG